MSTIDWPTSLPNGNDGSLDEGFIEPWVNDDASVGAPRRRARFTRMLKTFSFTMELTDDQAATLRTFVNTTSENGVLDFNWTHPVTAVVYEVRFSRMPSIRHVTYNHWSASVETEEI